MKVADKIKGVAGLLKAPVQVPRFWHYVLIAVLVVNTLRIVVNFVDDLSRAGGNKAVVVWDPQSYTAAMKTLHACRQAANVAGGLAVERVEEIARVPEAEVPNFLGVAPRTTAVVEKVEALCLEMVRSKAAAFPGADMDRIKSYFTEAGWAAFQQGLANPGLPKFRPDTNGLGTTDCRFEIRAYATSGQWTDETAFAACAAKVSADEERITQLVREQRQAVKAPGQ